MDHDHCTSCVLIKCNNSADNCPVVVCPNGCRASLHRCKIEEHVLYTCPTSSVPCINACFGCEAVLPRAKLGNHLSHCPASVVRCRFSYDRSAVDKSISDVGVDTEQRGELLIDEKALLADVALARRDGGEETSQPLQLDIDCHPGCDITNPSSKSSAIKQSLPPRGRACIPATVPQYNYYSNPSLSTKHYFSFPCNEIVRRDEFSAHWRDSHVEVQTSMSSIVECCPMRQYGCAHRELRMTPGPSGASLQYLEMADCIGLRLPDPLTSERGSEAFCGAYAQHIQKQQELACYGYGEESESYDVLSQLPAEILMKICNSLDSLGLWNLSMVNRYLRYVCFNLVKKRGIVYHKWQRNGDTKKWEQGEKVRHACLEVLAFC